jgi:hypothetical protein
VSQRFNTRVIARDAVITPPAGMLGGTMITGPSPVLDQEVGLIRSSDDAAAADVG